MYGELIIGINMLFNYAILSFANKIGNIFVTRKRLIIAAFIGGFIVTVFPQSNLTIFSAFVAMTFFAFGRSHQTWKRSAIFVFIGAIFAGGFLTILENKIFNWHSNYMILTYAIVAYASLYYMKKKWMDVRTIQNQAALKLSSTLHIWNEYIPLDVFVDSGNDCTEPLSGAPVHFVSVKAVEKQMPTLLKNALFSLDTTQLPNLSSFPQIYQKKIRPIQLVTVQGKSWAIGFKYEHWQLKDQSLLPPGYIVFTKNDRRYPNDTSAILHVSAMELIQAERGSIHAIKN